VSAPLPVICTLDEWDLPVIHVFALKRQAFKAALGVKSRRIDNSITDFGSHYIGAMGEYVVARELGISIDKAIYLGGDNGVDLHNYHGYTLQVKTIHYGGPNPHIVFPKVSDFKADACIAVQIQTPVTLAILGCISRQRFQDMFKPCNLGYGDNVAVMPDQLSALSVFLEIARE
jgi:hypothetical protein